MHRLLHLISLILTSRLSCQHKTIGIFLLPVPCVTAHVTQSSCGLPAKQHFCLFCRGEADRDISRPAANDLKRDMNPSGAFKCRDQLKDAMSPACSQIYYLHSLVRSAERKCRCVANGNVHDVNISFYHLSQKLLK